MIYVVLYALAAVLAVVFLLKGRAELLAVALLIVCLAGALPHLGVLG